MDNGVRFFRGTGSESAAAATVTDTCLSAFSAQRWQGLFLRRRCCQTRVLEELIIISDLIADLLPNSISSEAVLRLFRNSSFATYLTDVVIPPAFYGRMPAREATYSEVIQYETIPFIVPGEIPFPKLPLSQTFRNAELTQPHFSFSVKLLEPMAAISSGQGHAGKVC